MRIRVRHSRPTFHGKEHLLFKPVFGSGLISSGRAAENFEKKFSAYTGSAGALAVNSGTSALHLGLLALGLREGDEVIIPSYACSSLIDAVNYTRARPVLADIDHDTFNMSVSDTRRKLTNRTKAVIAVHLFGLPCDMDGFLKLGVPVIEDCSQSLGARYGEKMTGSLGAVSVFSFYATKLITTGYGGMAASGSKRLLDRMRDLASPDKNDIYRTRYNCRMSDLQALLGMDQLSRLKYFIIKRKEIAASYAAALSGLGLGLPAGTKKSGHIFYRYVVRSGNADRIKRQLGKSGIEVILPVHKPCHRYLSIDGKKFPDTEKAYREAVSLPIYPALTKAEVLKVIKAVKGAVDR